MVEISAKSFLKSRVGERIFSAVEKEKHKKRRYEYESINQKDRFLRSF